MPEMIFPLSWVLWTLVMMADRKPRGVRMLDQNQSVKFNKRKVEFIILEGLKQKLSNAA